MREAIADPDRFACEPKVDGVRGLVTYSIGGQCVRADRGPRLAVQAGHDVRQQQAGPSL